MRSILMICGWLLLGPLEAAAEIIPAAESKVAIETEKQIYRIVDGAIGCQQPEVLKRIVTYVVEEDTKAFKEAVIVGIAAGECTWLSDGHQVHIIEDLTHLKKVRPQGEHLHYWVLGTTVVAAKKKRK